MEEDRLIKRKQRVKRDGNLQQLAEIIKELGDLYYQTGKLEDALKEYQQQLEVCQILNDELNTAVAHRMIGETYTGLGNYEDALIHLNEYLEGAKKVKNLLEEQRAFATLGRTYFCFADTLPEESDKKRDVLVDAKKAYTRSIYLCNELENTNIKLEEMMTMRTRLLLNLGLVLEAQKEPEQAIDLIEKAAALCKKHKLDEDLHRINIALATIYENQGNTELALQHLDAAADVNNISLKAVARLTKIELLLKNGKWIDSRKILVSLYLTKGLPDNINEQVEKYLRIVVTICRNEENVIIEDDISVKLKLYETLGDAAIVVNSFEKAIVYYREMLKCAEDIGSEKIGAALTSLAQTLRDVDRYDEALQYAVKELELCNDPREICRSALFLADLQIATKSSSDDDIKKSFQLALSTVEQSNDNKLQISVLKNFLHYLKKIEDKDTTKIIQDKLNALTNHLIDDDDDDDDEENESEVESINIGGDICLEDLSDVENEIKSKENIGTTKRRFKRGLAVRRNEKGETQLHVACIKGNIASVEKFLEAGHPTNVRDHCGWTPLHEAANHDYIEIAELLLKNGAKVNDPGGSLCGGITPLHDAASCGNLAMMNLLMKYGANVILKTKDGDTVLDCLENWKQRAGDLSESLLTEYETMYHKLLPLIPVSIKNTKKPSPITKIDYNKLISVETDNEEVETVKKISAGEDYKRTIASLKHRGSLIRPITNSKDKSKISNPFVDTKEDLVDDWLEDDMGISSKKKCLNDSYNVTNKRKSNNFNIDDEETNNIYSKRAKIHSDDEEEEEEEEEIENDNIELIDSDNSNASKTTSPLPNSPKQFRKKKTKQISLFSTGFTKNSISRTPSPICLNSFDNTSQSNNTMSTNLQISVKNKIFHLKLILLDQDKNEILKNILEDTKKKFNDETGCIVELVLKTMDGGTVCSDNVIHILKDNENVKYFKCDIIKIEIPSIVERYKTICRTIQLVPEETTIKCLKSCDNTSVFRLKSDESKEMELEPLLKALEYQKNLQVLYLSGGIFLNSGNILSNCLENLSLLQELYLQRCDIDYNCLLKLNKLPVQLRVLDFSYNPLGPNSEEILHKLIVPLKNLQTLNLRHCELDHFKFTIESNNLVNLDLSWNFLNGDNIDCHFLQRQLVHLNLSNTLHPTRNSFITDVIKNSKMSSFITLESLELSCCDIIDNDVKIILQQAPNLTKIIFNGNSKISSVSVHMLLNRRPTLTHIDVSGCKTITEPPDSNITIKNPEVCTLIVNMISDICQSWLILWEGRGIVHKLPHNLTIFKPT
ncbi:PREDICTED: tonsoku-like protein [Polistes dominula]|uniref:Tonsoku-like protein n=1 Tax=Polistes dominula TaxID=743375 RepID=A0ABM1ISK9_POLDO|nr:PREDICTED: tonsoku-like protein [Polistes dominula]